MGSPLETRQSYENDTLCPLPPSGITDFEEFRKKGFVYVDKTGSLKPWNGYPAIAFESFALAVS